MGPGAELLGAEPRERLRLDHAPHEAHGGEDAVAVDALGEEVEVDRRRLARVRGLDVDAAFALGAQLVGDDGEPGLLGELDVGRHQEGLHRQHGVGAVEALARLEEGAHRRGRVAQEALALRDVEEALPQAAQAAGALVEGDAVAADAPFHARRPVVAQVLADAGQIVVDLDAELLEAVGLADAGELQQLRRGDGAGRHDHLAGRARLALLALTV